MEKIYIENDHINTFKEALQNYTLAINKVKCYVMQMQIYIQNDTYVN